MKTIIIAYMLTSAAGMGRDPSTEVNKMINQGWQPYGSISCSKWNCHQPMVKTKEVEE